MKSKSTLTIEDRGAPSIDFTITSSTDAVSIEVAGCLVPLSSKEAYELGRLLQDASFRINEHPPVAVEAAAPRDG